jgi:arabinogalactan endo-1,4-beta-galactosidase
MKRAYCVFVAAALVASCAGSDPIVQTGQAGNGAPGDAGAGGGAGTTGVAGAGGPAGGGGSTGVAGAAGGPAGGAGGGGGSAAAAAGRGGTSGQAGAAGSAGAAGRGGSGGGGSGGGGNNTFDATFYIGADITWVQADESRGATYSDGTQKEILQLLKDHGFNYVRMRVFVDPRAADGYDKSGGFGDLAHTITFGKRVKAAGMGFLVDFHYSDNWADPGKQCVPVAWQSFTTIAQMATAVHDYTKDAITQLVAQGARPDMVQVGNEITPGMLIHRCDSGGQPTGNNPVTGSLSSWTNLGMLLKAGVAGVKEVDAGILIMLHIDRGNNLATSRSFIMNAMSQGVAFDVFGESCYTAYQGMPSAWMSTFTSLATEFPNLKFVIAEYGPEQRAANDVMFNLAGGRGLGTFNWEPTHSGAWNTGHVLFSASGNRYTATADLSLYDAMKTAYASRL